MSSTLREVKTRYEVKEVLARGGMGVVYKAYDKVMKRPVALKTLLDITDSRAVKLFQKECEDLASLIHPNIVEIYDVGQLEDEDGVKPYLVMPLLPGMTLDKVIRDFSSRLTVERSIDIVCQICRGLHAAHERGLLHRDLKPSNIFVMDDDSVKIIDFGVAHRLDASQTVGVKGTLIYMSPEQVSMKPLTPASDIFSLGAVCYEALTLRRPFERSTDDEVAKAILQYVPPPVHELNPSVPAAVSQAVHKSLAKETAHRYRSAREFGETLQKALHNEPIEIFNPARLRPRLQRAREAFQKGDYDYASEILGELGSEGHLDSEITELRDEVDRNRLERRVSQLLQTARARMDEHEHQLALQKIDEALQLDPKNTEALALKSKIDTQRTDRDIEGWYEIARKHLDNRAFVQAREALRRIVELRPREAKAPQLLAEVERAEQSHQRMMGEKESLYRAAVEAQRAGDLSAALTKLDRLLSLDKQAPEPGRTQTYQRAYEKIHSEYEALKTARSETKQLLDDQKYSQALTLCEQYLAKYPGDTLLQALKWDIEEKKRQAISARIAETDRRVESEPDLNRRVSILEQALSENPGEVYFERALQSAREKRDGVNSIVGRARSYEEGAQYTEALAQWEMLQSIYPRYPGLRLEADRLKQRRDNRRRQEAKSRWVEQIDEQLEAGNFARAVELVQKGANEFPNDLELAELGRLAQQGLQRKENAQSLLISGCEHSSEGRFAEALDHLRRAHDLDKNDNPIRNALVDALVEHGRRLIDTDPDSGEKLLKEALALEPNQALAKGLLNMLGDKRKVETIDRALAQARRHQAGGELKQALAVIDEAASAYPDEHRLSQVQTSLQKALQEQRRQDFDQAKQIAQELDASQNLNDERRGQYAGRLATLMTAYIGDKELQDVLKGAKRQLETVVEPRPAGQSATAGSQSANPQQAAVAPAEKSVAARDVASTGSQSASGAGKESRLEGWARALRRKEVYIAAGAAAGLLALIVLAVLIFKPRPPQTVQPLTGELEIATVPSGAAVSIDGVETRELKRSLKPGTYNLEVRLPGYQTVQQQVTVAARSRASETVKLVPELPTLRIFGAGSVQLDGTPSGDIHDGQASFPLSAGDHTVRVKNGSSEISFKVRVDLDGLPAVTEINAKEMTPLIVSNFGTLTKAFSGSKTPAHVQLKGERAGDLTIDGMDLPALAPGSYDLTIGDGADAKTRTIETSASRTVSVLLETDLNVGRLVVKTTEDGATIVLLADGKEIIRKNTQNHQASFANVRARVYTVQVTKDGFDNEAPKTVEVKKGAEISVAMDLHKRAVPGAIQVKTTPGAEVTVNDKRAVAGADGTVTITGILPGNYTVEARLKGSGSKTARVVVGDGETKQVELLLTRAAGTVRIQKQPAEAVVTYRKIDESAEKPVTEAQLSLPEGTYVFTGTLPGYSARSMNVAVRAEETATAELRLERVITKVQLKPLGMDAWADGLWAPEDTNGWFLHKGDAFIGVTAPASADIEFAAPLTSGLLGAKRLFWALNYRDSKNYMRFELTEKNLTATLIKDGKNDGKTMPKAVKQAAIYKIRLEIHPGGTVVKINEQEIATFDADYTGGKFGFLGNKEVRMQNFRLEPVN